jgi:hypothetical protein
VALLAADLAADIQGSIFELGAFADGDDPDFERLPENIRLALSVLGDYADGESFDGEPGDEPAAPPGTGAGDAEARGIATSHAHQQANPLQVIKAESSMIQSKESIWAEIGRQAVEAETAKPSGVHGTALTREQAVTAFLATPAGSKLYDAWRSAPWDADLKGAREATTPPGPTSVTKSELEVSGETLLHNLAVKLQKDEGGSYVDAYAKVLDSAAGSLVYTTAFGTKRRGGKG